MAKALNTSGVSHAESLIKEGKIEDSKLWIAPPPEKQDEFIATRSMGDFGNLHLAVDGDKAESEKSRWEYQFSADGSSVNLRALRGVIVRAAKAGAVEVKDKAQALYDEAKAKLGKGKDRSLTAVNKICVRKSQERMLRNEVFVSAASAAGYTASDLMRWLAEELEEIPFPASDGESEPSCCCSAWPLNFVMPAHEKGETWQAIVQARGCMYAVDFTLGDAGLMIVGAPKEVQAKDQYVIMDEIVEEASDEASGRSENYKKARRVPPGTMTRVFGVDAQDADENNLELPVSFASELPGLQRCGGSYGDSPTDAERSAGLNTGTVYIEVLDHDEPDYSVLNNHGAVLDEHDEKDQIGVVIPGSARLDKTGRVSRARLRMDKGEKGRTRFRQMKDMIRPHLSAGYKHTQFVGKEMMPDGRTAYRFKFRGLEITSCAVPMDGTIGYGRSYKDLPQVDSNLNDESSEKSKEKSMTEAELKTAADAARTAEIQAAADKARTDAEAKVRAEMEGKITSASTASAATTTTNERTRFADISKVKNDLIKSRPDQEKAIVALADTALGDGTTVKDFQLRAMTEILNAKPATRATMETLGMRGEEYDLCRAVQNVIIMSDNGRKQGITAPDPDTAEGQAHLRMRKLMEKEGNPVRERENGFLVPADALISRRKIDRSAMKSMMKRDATMQSTIFGQGGATVPTELMLPIVDILRNEMVTTELGVTPMTGLEGNIAIPRQTAASTAYALGETAALTLSGQLLDQIVLSPHKVGAYNAYSRQLLLQSSMDLENFMRTDMFAVIALAWDEYILNGQGGQDQPTGILNQNGILLVNGNGSFTGYAGDTNAPSWADIVNFETQIAAINARRAGRAWATTSKAKGRLKTLARLLVGATTVPSVPLWEDGMDGDGMMNGYRAVDSQQIPGDLLIFGVWAQNVIHALWGGLNVIVDPYTGAANSVVKIYIDTFGDVAIRHPQEFCISLNPASA